MDYHQLCNTLFSEKDQVHDIRTACSSSSTTTSSSQATHEQGGRILAAVLERLRQITCRLTCRDVPLAHLWESRLLDLETNTMLLHDLVVVQEHDSQMSFLPTTTISSPTASAAKTLPINLRRSMFPWPWWSKNKKNKNSNNNNNKSNSILSAPMTPTQIGWMALFPWVLCCVGPWVSPAASRLPMSLSITVVWSSILMALTMTRLQPRHFLSMYDTTTTKLPSNQSLPSYGRQILDLVQRHMTIPTTSSSMTETELNSNVLGGIGSTISSSSTNNNGIHSLSSKITSGSNLNGKRGRNSKTILTTTLTSLTRRNDAIAKNVAETNDTNIIITTNNNSNSTFDELSMLMDAATTVVDVVTNTTSSDMPNSTTTAAITTPSISGAADTALNRVSSTNSSSSNSNNENTTTTDTKLNV